MKIFVKLMILALVLSFASLFIIKNPDGTPIKTLDSLVPSFEFSSIGDSISESLGKISSVFTGNEIPDTAAQGNSSMEIQTQEKILYRWQDERGVWNYSDTPPPGVNAEVMALEAPNIMNLNPIIGNSAADSDSEPDAPSNTEAVQTAESETNLIPDRIRQMQETIQSAEDVSNQLQEKFEEQQRILDEL